MAKHKPHRQDDVTDMGTVTETANVAPQDDVTDCGSITVPATETVDLGKLPPLAKFKKFQKKGK